MAQRMMWDTIERVFRGQASNRTVITVQEEAMETAHKKAGKVVYESDWWIETMTKVLDGWGIYGKRWEDQATRTQRAFFSLEMPVAAPPPPAPRFPNVTSPLGTGPLLSRISGKLNPKDVSEDGANK